MFVRQLQDSALEASSGSFCQLLQQPSSPALFHYSLPTGCSSNEFSPRPASQPMQTATCYYSSPPSSACHYGSPVIRHAPTEPAPLQFNVASSAVSTQHSNIPDIVLTGNLLFLSLTECLQLLEILEISWNLQGPPGIFV